MAAITSPDDEGHMPPAEYAAHVRTFNAFIAGAKWFVIHLFIVLVALYCAAIANRPVLGFALFVVSAGLLAYGFLKR